jgi:DNA-binding MurR/RpiR family transcriptional regulator
MTEATGANEPIVARLTARFSELSPRLRNAARFAIDNPEAIAVHSMRMVARQAGVHHNSMLRLAREMGYASYDEFRDLFRKVVTTGRQADWLDRARSVRESYPQGPNGTLIGEYVYQELANLQQTFGDDTVGKLNHAAEMITKARSVYVIGLRSLFPVSYYFHYASRLFANKTVLLTGLGGTFADELRSVGRQDVVLVFSYRPYSKEAVTSVRFARERGARIIAVTDSNVAPVTDADGISFVISNSSKSLFPTVLPALAIAQVLVTLLVSAGNEDTLAAITRSQEQLDEFGVYFE